MIPATTIRLNTDGSLAISNGHLALTTSSQVVEGGRVVMQNEADDQHVAQALQSVTGGYRLVPLAGCDYLAEINAPQRPADLVRLRDKARRTIELLGPYRVDQSNVTAIPSGDSLAISVKKVTRIR